MEEPKPAQNFKTTPEEARHNKRQVWLTLLVMLSSSCLGVAVLAGILWLVFKKWIPPGAL